MPLKGFLVASLLVGLVVLAWTIFAIWALYNGHPFIADGMNWMLTVGVIWYFGRIDEGANDDE